MARFKFMAILAVGVLAFGACGDDDDPTPGTDTISPDTSGTDTSDETDTTTTDTTVPTDAPDCGNRECGIFAGQDCGTCPSGQTCNAAGRCEVPGAPMGSFCGVTTTCNNSSPGWPGCINNQCASRNCLSASGVAVLLRDVCSAGCQIYEDKNNDFVNDSDAPFDDCNPSDIVDGPAGDVFRCVNFAGPQQTPLGLCAPTTTASVESDTAFQVCNKDTDCPTGEGCDLTSIGGDYRFRCVAKTKAGPWGDVVGLSQDCNDDPRRGDVTFCEAGLCFGLGCVTLCDDGDDTVCDTTQVYPGTGCDTATNTCMGKPTASCTTDIDCSGWSCGESRQIFGDGQGGLAGPFWRFCWPKGCVLDGDCGAGFYCRFFWNGVGGDGAALDSLCLAQNPDGVDVGEACQDNPNVPGNVCKNEDLCIGGFCSALCGDNDDCAMNQVCAVAELPGDSNDDGEIDFILPVEWCEPHDRNAAPCIADADCAADEFCSIYEIGNGGDPDAPYLLTGACTTIDASKTPWGQGCNSSAECQSGFCLGASQTQPGFCTKACTASDQCEPVSIGGDTANGLCYSLLYAWGGQLNNRATNLNIGLCFPEASSLTECTAAGFYLCDDPTEACIANELSVNPTIPGTVEFLCQGLFEENALPNKGVGEPCTVSTSLPRFWSQECNGGYCLPEGSGSAGYCSAVCDSSDTSDNNGTTCQEYTNFLRQGAYEDNSPFFHLWQK